MPKRALRFEAMPAMELVDGEVIFNVDTGDGGIQFQIPMAVANEMGVALASAGRADVVDTGPGEIIAKFGVAVPKDARRPGILILTLEDSRRLEFKVARRDFKGWGQHIERALKVWPV